jgi:membrane protein required for colicin V production
MNSGEFFNFLDYIYIILMFSSTMFGFVRGFIKDFFSTCAWFGSGFIAILASPYLIPFVYERVPNMAIARCVTIVIVYLIVLVIFLLIVSLMSQNVKRGVLSGVDRAVGVLFGLFRGLGVLICFCILMIIFEVPRDKYEIVKYSKLSVILFDISELLIPQMMQLGILDKTQKPHLLLQTGKSREKSPRKIKFDSMDKSGKGILIKKEKELVEAQRKTMIEPEKKKRKRRISFDFFKRIKLFIEKLFIKQPIERKIERIPSTSIQRINKPQYGSMSLMEARIRRRAQRKAEKLKKELEKLLDRETP